MCLVPFFLIWIGNPIYSWKFCTFHIAGHWCNWTPMKRYWETRFCCPLVRCHILLWWLLRLVSTFVLTTDYRESLWTVWTAIPVHHCKCAILIIWLFISQCYSIVFFTWHDKIFDVYQHKWLWFFLLGSQVMQVMDMWRTSDNEQFHGGQPFIELGFSSYLISTEMLLDA